MDRIDPSVYERADEGLLKLLEKANIAALTEEEYAQYEASMKALEDEIDMEQHGYKRGIEDGMKQGIQQGIDCTVRLLYSSGMSIKEISERLNMTESQIGTIVG